MSLTLLDMDLINIGQVTVFFFFTNLILNMPSPLNYTFTRLLHSVILNGTVLIYDFVHIVLICPFKIMIV